VGIFDGIPYALTGGNVGAAQQGVPSYVVISGPQTVGGQALPYTEYVGRTTLKSGTQGGTIGASIFRASPFFRVRSPRAAASEFYQSAPGRRLTQSAPGAEKLARDIAKGYFPRLPKRKGRKRGGGGFAQAGFVGGGMGGGLVGDAGSGIGAALNPTTLLLIGVAVVAALAFGVRRPR
jgi:hypothetical protein